ncbi:orotidine 5'-phosphate decarboxylase [Candidatus Pacearchaeota archaeon]|nr:orotidine 5'-phosphate decarboxylase [Candidatus Pacearchaeota archaeon]
MSQPFLYIALDYPTQDEVLSQAKDFTRAVKEDYGFKVNLDTIANFSPSAGSPYDFMWEMLRLEKPLFFDFKMWNGERTMRSIIERCGEAGIDIVNIYAHAGEKFIKNVKESLENTPTLLFALTVLSHYNDSDTRRLYKRSFGDSVKMLSRIAEKGGADGIILPGTELHRVKRSPLLKLATGIRPTWYKNKKKNNQEQIVTPEEATAAGADFYVMGSPILDYETEHEKIEALERVLSDIKTAASRQE